MALPGVSPGFSPDTNFNNISAAIAALGALIDAVNALRNSTSSGFEAAKQENVAANNALSGRITDLSNALNAINQAIGAELLNEARIRESAVADLGNALRVSITNEIQTRSAYDDAEAAARKDADEQLRALLDDKLGADQLDAAVGALNALLNLKASVSDLTALAQELSLQRLEYVRPRHRPGDAPGAFCIVPSAYGMVGYDLPQPPLADSLIVYSDVGRVARLAGTTILARRAAEPIEAGRVYRVRCVVARRTNPSDPSNDAVQFGLTFLDQAMNSIPGTGVVVIDQIEKLTVSDGRQEIQSVFSRSPGQDVQVLAPSRARYARPYVRTFGPDGVTDVEVLEIDDITTATVFDPVSADIVARVGSLESAELSTRLAAVEAQITAPQGLTFSTKVDAASAQIPETVTTVELRGSVQAGDGLGGLYVRTAKPVPPGADSFTASGANFIRVFRPNDLYTAEMQLWFYSLPTVEPSTPGLPWRNSNTLAWS